MKSFKPKLTVEAEPFIPYVEAADFPQRLKPLFEPDEHRMGFVPNVLKLYMHRPEIAEALWTLSSRIMRDPSSTLDQGLKRKLGVVATTINGSRYCTAHLCWMLKRPPGLEGEEGWGLGEEELRALVSGAFVPKDEFERVCFDYVRAASVAPGKVPDELLQRLKLHLSPPQVVELACVAGFWKLCSTVDDSLRIPVEYFLLDDADYVDLAPVRASK